MRRAASSFIASVRTLSERHQIDNRILIAALVFAAALYGFLELASEVLEGEVFAFDHWLLQTLRDPGNPSIPRGPEWLREVMVDATALGGVPNLALITLLAAGYLVTVRKARTAAFLAMAVSLGALVGALLKQGIVRARPDLVAHLVEVDSPSFPSGHATNSAITYLTLAALLARSENGRPVRIYLLAVGIGLTLLIGFSRVYLGVHWPTDVIAGWCVGAAWAIGCSLVARWLQRRKELEPRRENGSAA